MCRMSGRVVPRGTARPSWSSAGSRTCRPYVFTIINNLKIEARRAGVDVIDLGFGNPDIPSPADRRREAGRGGPDQPATTATRCRKGLPKLRVAVAALYQRNWGVDARPRDRDHQHDRVEGGLQPPDVGAARSPATPPSCPSPSYPIHIYGPLFAGADLRQVPMRMAPGDRSRRLLRGPRDGVATSAGRSRGCSSSRSRTTRPARASTSPSCSGSSTSAASTR